MEFSISKVMHASIMTCVHRLGDIGTSQHWEASIKASCTLGKLHWTTTSIIKGLHALAVVIEH